MLMISLNPLFLSLFLSFSPSSSSPHSPIQPTIINCNNIVDLPEVKGSHRKFRTIVSSLIGTCNMVYGVCSLIKKVYKLRLLWGPPSLKRCPPSKFGRAFAVMVVEGGGPGQTFSAGASLNSLSPQLGTLALSFLT